ncbi:hypothetical protein [Gordonia sp. CPCC 205333]|uniref:hypothetical protein n=1 Tax=Gordonia sp. CPCC 205333 TaxID=3140790 RepID=UPI003AF401FE
MTSPRLTFALAVVVVLSALGITSCSVDSLTGGAANTTSYPPVTTPQPPPLGSWKIPAGFPAEVPIIDGRYRLTHQSDSIVLSVTAVQKAEVNRARTLLEKAGYSRESVLGQSTFVGPKYLITVTDDDIGYGMTIVYRLSPISNLPGIPQLPQMSLPPLP